MTKEEAIVYTLSITKSEEAKNFQIRLPDDTKRIIGLEWGVVRTFYAITGNYTDPEWWQFPNTNDLSFQVKPTRVIGELTLQTMGTENIFFRGEVNEIDNNLFWADFSKPSMNQFKEWTHGRKREELEINVASDRIVEAYYKDRWGIVNAVIARYKLHLYLWIEKDISNDHPTGS